MSAENALGTDAPLRLLGMGSVGLDYLAAVAAFPQPDEKLRTERLETQGGGNCANALTAAARLGAVPSLVAKIADDGPGAAIRAELERDGVGTQHLVVDASSDTASSPFTYIIVDAAGGTRTCIHTPGPAWDGETDLAACGVLAPGGALAAAAAVFFDGRLAESAADLAAAARAAGVPVLVEGERLRPGLDALLACADAVTTSAAFPGAWTGLAHASGRAAVAALARCPRARWLVTTLGERGAVLIERVAGGEGPGRETPRLEEDPDAVFEAVLAAAAAARVAGGGGGGGGPGWGGATSPTGAAVGPPGLASRTATVAVPACDAGAAAAAGMAAAAANADAGRGSAYAGGVPGSAAVPADADALPAALTLRFTAASSPSLPPGAFVDGTGAGDAFNGALLIALARGWGAAPALRLAAVTAGCACTALGARAGLPAAGDVDGALLAGAGEGVAWRVVEV